MGALGKLLGAMMPAVLDWAGGKIYLLFGWAKTKIKSSSKKRARKKKIDAQLERHKLALKEAYDGESVTPEQQKELDDSFAAIVRDY